MVVDAGVGVGVEPCGEDVGVNTCVDVGSGVMVGVVPAGAVVGVGVGVDVGDSVDAGVAVDVGVAPAEVVVAVIVSTCSPAERLVVFTNFIFISKPAPVMRRATVPGTLLVFHVSEMVLELDALSFHCMLVPGARKS